MSTLNKNTPSNNASESASDTNTPSNVTSLKSKEKQSKNQPQKLTLSNINKLTSKFNEKKKVYIGINNEEFEVILDANFRKTTIQKVVVDYIKFLHALKSMEGIDEETILNSTIVLDVLVLKHFTNLPIPDIKENEISKLIKIAQNLVDLGIVEELLGGGKNSFSQENIELVRTQTNKALENMGKTLGELGLKAELNEAEKNRIDVDNYFSELELRSFEIAEDEDLSMLPKVMKQLNDEGKYDEYINKLTSDELGKLEERMRLWEENSGDEDGEEVY